jgi:hypothetical protein
MGFFAVLTLLALTAVSLEVWYTHRQQLTPEALDAARRLWAEKGPADYDLKYLVSYQRREDARLTGRSHDDSVSDVEVNGEPLDPAFYPFHDLAPLLAQGGAGAEVTAVAPSKSEAVIEVRVRGGKAVGGSCGGRPLPPGWAGSYEMAGLFAALARVLEQDEYSGAWRPYVVASFDRNDGHLVHFVRSRMQARERVEIQVGELKRVELERPAQAPTDR